MGFQPSQKVFLSHLVIQRSKRPLFQLTLRHLSVDKTSESHLLPRLYVGPTQESALSLSQFLNDNNQIKSQQVLLQEGTALPLSANQAHYVTNVMRMLGPGRKKGRWTYDQYEPCVRMFTQTSEWVARLEAMDDLGQEPKRRRRKNNMESLTVLATCIAPLRDFSSQQQQHQGWLQPILCLAPPKKKDRFQWILEKSTELGMEGWLLVQTDRTDGTSSSGSRDYWRKGQAYVLEAAEQCERLSVPPVLVMEEDSSSDSKEPNAPNTSLLSDDSAEGNTFSPLSLLLKFMEDKKDTSLLICRERSDSSTPILKALETIRTRSTDENDNKASRHCCLVLVGPEGGWSPEEEAAFDDAAAKHSHIIWNVSLGDNVLRTDTAAVTAMAAFSLIHDNADM